MAFEGYKLKFSLQAGHSNIKNDIESRHYHTFIITLYLKNNRDDMDLYDKIEKYINDKLEPYQRKYLSETVLFENKDTSLESIGDTFFDEFKEITNNFGFDLIRLEIYENPTCTYSVSDRILDSVVNQINVLPMYLYTESRPNKEEILPGVSGLNTLAEDEFTSKDQISSVDGENSNGKEDSKNQDQQFITSVEHVAATSEQQNNKDEKSPSNNRSRIFKLIIATLILFPIACLIMYIVKVSGDYPRGSDTLCHLYRADLLLGNIEAGVWYPLYDPMWYNGVEIMRYWAPIPLYILAFLEFISHNSILDAYILFIGVVFVVGAFGWILFGLKYNRIGLATFLGIVWFFLPENMRLLIMDGNLPRVVINTAMPFLLYFIWKLIREKKTLSIIPIMLILSFMGLCHIGIAIMVVVTVLIFAGIYSKIEKNYKEFGLLCIGVVISFLVIGIWMYPSLQGGAVGQSETGNQVMQTFFQNGFTSLNPSYRWNGDLNIFYYSISLFIICILGVFLGNKKTLPGFLTGLIIFTCTTQSIYIIFAELPFSKYLWMIRFIPISLSLIFLSLLLWKELKKKVVFLICLLLFVDSFASYQFIYVEKEYRKADVEAQLYEMADELLLNTAKDITTQRMAVFDLSKAGAFIPYYVAGVGDEVAYTFGAGWEGAYTASNIVHMNYALEKGYYTYVFDRCLELGNDTIVFYTDLLENKEKDVKLLISSGKKVGYEVVKHKSNGLIFHMDIDHTFGTIDNYENITIGSAANEMSIMFPNFKEGESTYIDDYSFDELKDYKKIYLSKFDYHDKVVAEELLTKLADQGVKIYIDMNAIPVDKGTNQRKFLGVYGQSIIFNENYPNLIFDNKTFYPEHFTDDIDQWNTVYLSGIKNSLGHFYLNEEKVDFVGTADHENITFIGLNVVYYAQVGEDNQLKSLVMELFEESMDQIPEREVVPVNITYESDSITIKSSYDNVNTNLAFLDIFHADRQVKEQNHLVVVDSGVTKINLQYPYLQEGLTVTIIGGICFLLYVIFLVHDNRKLKKGAFNHEI